MTTLREPSNRLTPREAEIVAAVASGQSRVEIGQSLGISDATMRGHLENIRNKTGTAAIAPLTMLAVALGLAENPFADRVEELCPKSG